VFSILSVRFEQNNAAPDYRLARRPLSRIKAGSIVELSIYVNVASGPPRITLGGHITLRHGGSTVLDHELVRQTLPDNPIGRHRIAVAIKFSSPGAYVALVVAALNGQPHRGTTAIFVTKNPP
jgi:hypothetical protein